MYKISDVVLLKTNSPALVVGFLEQLVDHIRPKHMKAYSDLVEYYKLLHEGWFDEIMLTIEPRYKHNTSLLSHARLIVRLYVPGPGISCEALGIPKNLLLFEKENDNQETKGRIQ